MENLKKNLEKVIAVLEDDEKRTNSYLHSCENWLNQLRNHPILNREEIKVFEKKIIEILEMCHTINDRQDIATILMRVLEERLTSVDLLYKFLDF